MNILEVGKHFHPSIGGIEVTIRSLAESLSGEHSVSVLAAQSGLGSGRAVNADVDVTVASSVGSVQSVPVAPTFPALLRYLANDADLVHYHLPNPLATTSHLAAVPEDVATVATYHSDIVRQRRALKLYRPLLERFLEGVDHLIATSPRIVEESPHLAPFSDKCTVAPLGIDAAVHDGAGQSTSTIRSDGAGRSEEDPLVLFAGRLVYYKGVEHLIRAMTDVDARLVVVGNGPRRPALEATARDVGVDEKVQFTGFVDDATLHEWYERADVFALPSVARTEAFGRVQLEAMAHGTPVVNTDLPTGVPWVSRHRETGMTVLPEDPAALASAIQELLSDRELRARYGRRARRRVREEFDREDRIETVESVFRAVHG